MLILNNTEVVLKVIKENDETTNGSCGLSMIVLKEKSEIDYAELRTILITLYNKKQIIVREGINHKLIYLNKNYAMQNM